MIGEPDGPPTIPYNIIADFAGGGFHAAMAILAALMARQHTGRGQYVDIAMSDGVAYMLASLMSEYFATGTVPDEGRDEPEWWSALLQRVPVQGRGIHQRRLYRAVVLVHTVPGARSGRPDRGAVRGG